MINFSEQPYPDNDFNKLLDEIDAQSKESSTENVEELVRQIKEDRLKHLSPYKDIIKALSELHKGYRFEKKDGESFSAWLDDLSEELENYDHTK